MAKTRQELDSAIDALERRLPAMLEETRPEDWMEAFAGEAEPIRDAAGPEDLAHVDSRIQCLLRDAGLIPGDDEPCSE
jgi:hypothetical protein